MNKIENIIHIIILGGTNNVTGILNKFTELRIIKVQKLISNSNQKFVCHFSGGFNKKFNNTNISHAEICQNYFLKIMKKSEFKNIEIKLHKDTDNTVEEAIYFGNYFKDYIQNNTISNIIIITNDWHKARSEYLFDKVFESYEINNYEIIGVESDIIDKDLINDETDKLTQLEEKPYGLWKDWLINNYYKKYVSLRLIEKNDSDGKLIVSIRNENNEYFFDKNKFDWNNFKDIFYKKYFSNEIPPYFVYLNNDIIGFIGCKTITKNINDIGIMFYKKYQNKGLGKESLHQFLKIYDKIYANSDRIILSKILKNNIASYKIFIANGFNLNENKTTEDVYYLTYK